MVQHDASHSLIHMELKTMGEVIEKAEASSRHNRGKQKMDATRDRKSSTLTRNQVLKMCIWQQIID